jgi:hypothetical protein
MRLVGALTGVFAMSQVASAQPSALSDDTRIDRLTDEIVKMIPLGPELDALAAADPRWPLQSIAPEDVKPEWLSCARESLSTRGYREYRRAETAEYANEYPDRVDSDLAVLSAGAAEVFAELARQGIEAGKKNQDVSDPKALVLEVLKKSDPQRRNAFIAFASGEEHTLLRRFVGVESTHGKVQSGQTFGDGLVQRLMEATMKRCRIPDSLRRPTQG